MTVNDISENFHSNESLPRHIFLRRTVLPFVCHVINDGKKRHDYVRGRSGRGGTGQGSAGQDRAGQDRAGQGRAGQGRAGQGRAGQGRAGQGKTGQGKARQDKAGRGGTGQGRAGRDKTRRGGAAISLVVQYGDPGRTASGRHRGDEAPLACLGVPPLHRVHVGPAVVPADRVQRALQHRHAWQRDTRGVNGRGTKHPQQKIITVRSENY